MTSKSRVQTKGTRMPSAEMATAGGLKQCRQAQDQLEDAISGVMKAEQQLRENTREVRAELQSCVSRQQEALRCREVWLLGQIELLEQVKTETLQQQLHQLHRLRGQFDVIVHQLQNSNSSKDLNNQLTSCMEKLSSLSLTPEETPEMSFRADTRSLRLAITSFGSITAQLVEGVSSQSCPIAAKKQKMEVGALGDWLMGTPPSSSAPIGYQGSKDPQDWLIAHKESKESKISCPVLASMDFLQAWGQLRDLEAWVLQDQTAASRERTYSSSSSSFSIEKIDESELAVAPEDEEEEEVEEEMSDWLITPPTVAMETMSDAERWRRVLKPFEDGWSSSDWLLGSRPPAADCSSCCQTTKALEIENLGQLKCLKTPPASPESPPTPAALEAWLQQVVPVQQNCRGNEVCSSYADCVCDENCGRDALSHWLLRQDGRDKNGVPVDQHANMDATPTTKHATATTPASKNATPTLHHREQEQKVQAILEAWLHPSNTTSLSGWVVPEEEKASREEHSSQFKPSSSSSFSYSSSSSCLSPFQSPLDPDLWLIPGQTRESGGQPSAAAEEDKWLLKKRSQAQERLAMPSVCDLFSCMKVGGDKEKWLHRAAEQM